MDEVVVEMLEAEVEMEEEAVVEAVVTTLVSAEEVERSCLVEIRNHKVRISGVLDPRASAHYRPSNESGASAHSCHSLNTHDKDYRCRQILKPCSLRLASR